VESPVITLRVTAGMRDDVAYTVHGFGQQAPALKKAYQHGFSDNALMTRMTIDPLTGTTGMRVNFVRVQLARKG
jgi:thiosulfate reductase/polysulfide reductase chain A